jgi:hypothetical protein
MPRRNTIASTFCPLLAFFQTQKRFFRLFFLREKTTRRRRAHLVVSTRLGTHLDGPGERSRPSPPKTDRLVPWSGAGALARAVWLHFPGWPERYRPTRSVASSATGASREGELANRESASSWRESVRRRGKTSATQSATGSAATAPRVE